MPHEVLFFSSNSSKKIVFRNLCLSVITCIIMVINPFLTLFELENATVNKTDSDFTLLTCIRGNIQTSKGWHIFEWKDGSHQVRIEVKLHGKNPNVSNIIIMLDLSIINNSKFLIFSACMENFNHIQVVGHIISLTRINNNTSRRDFIPFYRAVSTPQISGGDLLNLLLEYENKGEERNMPRDEVCCSCNIWCRRLLIHF